MIASLQQRALQIAPKLVEIRRTLHRFPELGFNEHRTAALVADTLSAAGIQVTTDVGVTGVIGNLGSQGPVVALRADMDALPIQEQNPVEYASAIPGVMHACGHDAHTACLLGAALLLSEMAPAGRVRFLFQPAEEGMDEHGKSGAMRLVEEGACEGVEAVFGLHVNSKDEAGTISVSPGYILASLDNFRIILHGRGAHAAQANLGVDAILLSAQVITALHTIVSRRIAPLENAVLSIGVIQGGTQENNLAETVELRGTIRSFNPAVRQALIQEMHQACGIVTSLGGNYELIIQEGYPALKNDPCLAEFARRVAVDLAGPQAAGEITPEMGAEDFSFYTRQVPGCYLNLGSGVPGQPLRPHHSPHFDIDESILPLGAALLAALAIRYLDEKPLNPSAATLQGSLQHGL